MSCTDCQPLAVPWLLAALTVLIALALPVGGARAQATEGLLRTGQSVGGYRVVREEKHSEYLRYYFERGRDGHEVGIEIVADGTNADQWRTGRSRLMPAPDSEPPAVLLEEVMDLLRSHDARTGQSLVHYAKRKGTTWVSGSAPPPSPGIIDLRKVDAAGGAPPPPSPGIVDLRKVDAAKRALVSELGDPTGSSAPWAVCAAVLVLLVVGTRRGQALRAWMGRRERAWSALGLLAIIAIMLASNQARMDVPFSTDDQTQRIFIGTLDLDDLVAHRYADARHPPLFYLLLHAFVSFDLSEATARTPALLFALLTVVGTFLLARPTLGHVRALCTAAMVAVHFGFSEHGTAVSDVPLFTCIVVWSTHLLLRTLSNADRRLLAALLLLELALFYTYYMAPVVFVCHLVIVAMAGAAPGKRALLWGMAAVPILALPTLSRLTRLVGADHEMRQVSELFPRHLWGQETLTTIVPEIGSLFSANGTEWALILAAAAVPLRLRRDRSRHVVIAQVVITVLGVMAVGVVASSVRMKPYYAVYVLPMVAFLIVYGGTGRATQAPAATTPGQSLWAAAQAGLLATIVAGWVQAPNSAAAHPAGLTDSARYRDVGAHIRLNPGPATLVADPSSLYTLLLYYRFDESAAVYRSCREQSRIDRADDASGSTSGPRAAVRCYAGGHELLLLTEQARLQPGWEQDSITLLTTIQRKRPTRVIYNPSFSNDPLLGHLRAHCVPEARFGETQPLDLYSCPPLP